MEQSSTLPVVIFLGGFLGLSSLKWGRGEDGRQIRRLKTHAGPQACKRLKAWAVLLGNWRRGK
jgi:hypothetical protein